MAVLRGALEWFCRRVVLASLLIAGMCFRGGWDPLVGLVRRQAHATRPFSNVIAPTRSIAPSYAERPPAATFREGTSGPGGRKAPKDALVAGRVICPSAEFSSSRPAPKGREREYRPFINRALHESSGFCAMEGWMLAASTVSIIRVGRVENPIRAPDKRLNNSEQNLKMERSARALCTLMIGFRPWI